MVNVEQAVVIDDPKLLRCSVAPLALLCLPCARADMCDVPRPFRGNNDDAAGYRDMTWFHQLPCLLLRGEIMVRRSVTTRDAYASIWDSSVFMCGTVLVQ